MTTGIQPDIVQLVVSWAIRHTAETDTVIGSSVETFMGALDCGEPFSWGTEDLGERLWDTAEMTRFIRTQMPGPTHVKIMGGPDNPAALTMTVNRTSLGLEEVLTGFLDAGPWRNPISVRRVDKVADALGEICVETMPLFAIVLTRGGWMAVDSGPLTRMAPDVDSLAPMAPVAMLIGPPGVHDLNVDIDRLCGQFDAKVAGRPQLPALVFPLLSDNEPSQVRLARILTAIGEDKIQSILGWDVHSQGGV